jgi:hypothetical protein
MPQSNAKFDLEAQLASYAATKPENWSAHLKRWPIYAAATGAALAMATSADAGTIVSGTSGSYVSIPGGAPLSFNIPGFSSPVQVGWLFGSASQWTSGGWARAGLSARMSFAGYRSSSGQFWLNRFSRGQSITNSMQFSHWGLVRAASAWVTSSGGRGTMQAGWPGTANGGGGYAGFRLPAGSTASGGPAYNLGWIQLTWLSSMGNGVPTELIAGNWAVDTTPGEPINAGNAPEPGTMALSLLACGAAGIAAWRKARKARS